MGDDMAMPMGATTSSATSSAASTTSRTGPAPTGARAVVARLTGLSAEQVAEQVAGGVSLATIAQRAGVARSDLVSALVEHAPQALRSTGRAEQIVNRVVDEVGEIDRPGGTEALSAAVRPMVVGTSQRPRAHRSATGLMTDITTGEQREALGSVAELLGMDPGDLATRLRDGDDLVSMLESAGFERPAIASALGRGVMFDASA